TYGRTTATRVRPYPSKKMARARRRRIRRCVACTRPLLSEPSPRVDARPLLSAPPAGWRHRAERRRDPPARVGRVDHVVELEVGRVAHRLAVLVHAGDHLLEDPGALRGIVDRRELLAVAELDRALEPHAAELARRPGDGEQRC